MKRLIALFVVLNIMLCSLAASAESETVVFGSHETAKPGETVSVTVKLQDNPGLAAWKIELEWDDTALTLDKDSVSLDKDFSKGMLAENSNESGKLILAWANVKDIAADGNLITLTFKVADDAAAGTHSISVNASGTRNENGDKIAVAVSDGSITLTPEKTDYPSEDPSVQEPVVQPEPKPDDDIEDKPVSKPADSVDLPQITPPIEEPYKPRVSFSDVSADAYYYQPVQWAVEGGITSGTSSNTFSPELSCNRAQMVTFLWRAAGCPLAIEFRGRFSDVEPGAYYEDAVAWALSKGITSGTSENTFSPSLPVTRGQVVTFLWRYAGWDYSAQENMFHDVSDDAYYGTAVCWAVAKNITKGMSVDMFSPDITCTRGQIVTFLYRYYMK